MPRIRQQHSHFERSVSGEIPGFSRGFPKSSVSTNLPALDSQILSVFPEIFAEFGAKRFGLLWRGSRDGFEARTFYRLCDGRSDTVTVILDTTGNIFGGFTPVAWE
jgi:hypothetical protein